MGQGRRVARRGQRHGPSGVEDKEASRAVIRYVRHYDSDPEAVKALGPIADDGTSLRSTPGRAWKRQQGGSGHCAQAGRFWTPSLEAAGVKHRRIDDLRHTYATWSLAAGVDIFALARRMGTSVKMIGRTYGHLMAGADVYERELLDAFDAGLQPLGRYLDAEPEENAA
jgi:integrase